MTGGVGKEGRSTWERVLPGKEDGTGLGEGLGVTWRKLVSDVFRSVCGAGH